MKSQHKWLWWLASPFIFMVAWYLFTQLINPLPSDEKMIGHFQTHRVEFETLVKNYQKYQPYAVTPNKILFNEIPENKVLMKKAAIIWVSEEGVAWFPNPYSAEASKQFAKLGKQAGANGLDFIHPYRSIRFTIENPPLTGIYRAVLLFSGVQTVMKDFRYIPEIAKIENGRLWYPVTPSGNMKWSDRAFSSLNYYPFGWEVGECVYRQFEPHWFIRMCITY